MQDFSIAAGGLESNVHQADVLITLNGKHGPTADYIKTMREVLPRQFPGTSFAFLPADIVSQILNFGLPSPIDIQIVGASPKNRDLANEMLEKLRHVPGLVDLRVDDLQGFQAAAHTSSQLANSRTAR